MIYAVAMSGGVDSSVAATICKENYANVIGFTMVNFDDTAPFKANCNNKMINDAQNVCKVLDIPHFVIDLSKEFIDIVINNFTQEYLNGRTPNPCVICNRHIKWGVFYDRIKEIIIKEYGNDDISFITGHYAQKTENNLIKRALEKQKDQTYMLWNLTAEQINRTMFPLSSLTKAEVRRIASNIGLEVSNKKDSQDICFLEGKYTDFLSSFSSFSMNKTGNILYKNQEVIGVHKGLIFYTLGQRKGLPSWSKPLFVKRIDALNNQIIVTDDENELYTDSFQISHINQQDDFVNKVYKDLKVQIRYNSTAIDVKCISQQNDAIEVLLSEPAKSVTSGQSAVFYCANTLLGGGIIV
jgi:tRNA-specific 2-thiouridylase